MTFQKEKKILILSLSVCWYVPSETKVYCLLYIFYHKEASTSGFEVTHSLSWSTVPAQPWMLGLNGAWNMKELGQTQQHSEQPPTCHPSWQTLQ